MPPELELPPEVERRGGGGALPELVAGLERDPEKEIGTGKKSKEEEEARDKVERTGGYGSRRETSAEQDEPHQQQENSGAVFSSVLVQSCLHSRTRQSSSFVLRQAHLPHHHETKHT